MLRAFDAPSREECTATRPRSNTPLSALVLMNDPTFVEAGRALAVRIIKEGGKTPKSRINWAMQNVLSREAIAGGDPDSPDRCREGLGGLSQGCQGRRCADGSWDVQDPCRHRQDGGCCMDGSLPNHPEPQRVPLPETEPKRSKIIAAYLSRPNEADQP